MMKNYLFNLKSLTLLGVALASACWNAAMAQCGIAGPTEGCQGAGINFTATGTSPGDAISWSAGSAGTASGLSANFTFTNPGPETITITVTGASGTCTKTLNFTVNAAPVPNFTSLSTTPQCYNGNNFCFKDASTPGTGRSFNASSITFLFGDGGIDSSTGPGGTFCHSYPNPIGGVYCPFIRARNDKGCVTDWQGPCVTVRPDIGADFTSNVTTACGTTVAPLQNTSAVLYQDVKSFKWVWGDTSANFVSGSDEDINLCYWSPSHPYSMHGCFNVTLEVEDIYGCKDDVTKNNFVCNINPQLIIQETNGKDAQCQVGNAFVFTHNINPLNWQKNFVWIFDDPDSGPLNFDDVNFTDAPHVFTKPDVYTVTIVGTIANCPFSSSIDVLTKGPAATIDAKAIPDIVADSLRHQCQIKDTVYFKNNSAFNFNDVWILDDVQQGAASVLKENNMVLVDYTESVRAWEKILDVYVWHGDTMAVIELPLTNSAHNSLIKDNLVMFDNFFGAWGGERQDDHVRTVWDFGDQFAPQCTTWTRFMQNVWDANGKWMNCNFSRDPKPKHWYTPGKEQCYTVTLKMGDTTYAAPGQGYKYYSVLYFDNTLKEEVLVEYIADTVLYNKYKKPLAPDPSAIYYEPAGVWNDTARFLEYMTLDSVFRYPPLLTNGQMTFVYSPYCDSLVIDTVRNIDKSLRTFVKFDTTFNKWYINPNLRNGNFCEAQTTLLLALEGPNASGLKKRPFKGAYCLGSNPTWGVTFDWSSTTPSCTRQFVWMNFDSLLDRRDGTPLVLDKWTPQDAFLLDPTTPWILGTLGMPQWPNQIYYDYTGIIADSCGRITVGLRVQNGKDPYTGLPCVDEKWYHDYLDYVDSDPEFTLDTTYGCGPLEVELTFKRDYMDSLNTLAISVQKNFNVDWDRSGGFTYVDSVFRNKYDPVTGTNINYVLTYYIDDAGKRKIDSFTFIPGSGGVSGCGSELKIKKKRLLTLTNPGRWEISTEAKTTENCTNNSVSQFVVVGFEKFIEADKKVICRNEIVNFYDSALYLLQVPNPITGDQYILHNYWRDQNRLKHPDSSNRTPTPRHETTNWNFDQGDGFTTLRFWKIPVTFPVPGHYTVRAEFMDSIGCKDTLSLELDVTGVATHFDYTINIGNCKPIVNFRDLSKMFDPCKLQKGIPCDSIIRWIWDFGDGSPIINTTSDAPIPPIKNPSHVYQRFGDFDVKLIVETRLGCFDTLTQTLTVQGPMPKFDFAVDSIGCAPYTVYLSNFSLDPSPGAQWVWDFDDTSNGGAQTVDHQNVISHTYNTPGKYKLTLIQYDSVPLTGEKCRDTFPSGRVIEVTVLPEKKVDFIISKKEVCPDEIITFTDTSDTAYNVFMWDFGDGNVLTKSEEDTGRIVTHSYDKEGEYIVRLTPDYTPPPGEPKCRATKSYIIKVKDVNANFSIDSSGMPHFKFKNLSTNAKEHWWRFGDGDGFTPCPLVDPVHCPDAEHNYGDKKGKFDVCLVVLSPEGCYDTTCATVENRFEVSITIPNVFTPNGDGSNDKFVVDIKAWTKYEIFIYNRFSEKVFESNDPSNPWNGKLNNTGADLPGGVYYVVINYQLRGEPEKSYNGTVTLIRN